MPPVPPGSATTWSSAARGSEALLSVTDARAETSERPTILKAYRAVRGGAAKHVVAALPNVSSLVHEYAA